VAEYARHDPEKTLLHEVVREQLEGFLASASHRDQPVPRFIEQQLRAFLRCGVLAHGFLRLHCDECGHDRLVAFSCKRRGFCPSCGGRRMADTAAHLVDRVLPEVPIRQCVLTLPYPLRYRCAYDAKLTSEVLRAFLRALFAELRRRTRRQWGIRAEQCGAVTFIQRFAAELRSACASHAPRARGSALNLNLHFHTLALDGGYTGRQGRPLRSLRPTQTKWRAYSRVQPAASSASSKRAPETAETHAPTKSLSLRCWPSPHCAVASPREHIAANVGADWGIASSPAKRKCPTIQTRQRAFRSTGA
jgi:hypothetical protein